MRVIAGKYRSRILRSLKGNALRPTSDRLRETLFNILGTSVEQCTFVDLYAGTGAVGIEALSRDASAAILVEHHAPAARLIEQNLKSLGIGKEAKVIALDVARGLDRLEALRVCADFIFFDPPYEAVREYQSTLDYLGAGTLLAAGGKIIAEHLRKHALPERVGILERARVVEQGDAALSFYKVAE